MNENNHKIKRFQYIFILFLFVIGSFFSGLYFGMRGYQYEILKSPPFIDIQNKNSTEYEIDFKLFWTVWDLVNNEYLLRPLDPQKMLYGAIEGMVSALDDPYTMYLRPETNEEVQSSLNGIYQGIGAELGVKDRQIFVVSPMDGSPAKEAGIMPGDLIIQIDGEDTFGMNLFQAVSKIRGDAGTIVSLTIFREGDSEPRDIKIKRGQIKIDSVTWEDKGSGIAYIRIGRFGETTNSEWDKIAAEVNVQMNELDAIVLDLRGNPGGYMQSAVHIAGEFFRNEVVMYQKSTNGPEIPYNTTRIGIFDRLPVYVLIDEGSASASEILAGALKYHVDATLVGAKSFGKGTIQETRDFADGSGVHITIAKWLTPDRKWVNDTEGISPDIEIEFNTELYEESKYDSQLEELLELIKSGN